MTPHRHWVHDYTPHQVPIHLADDSVVWSAGMGVVHFIPEGKCSKCIEFKRVLHVPDLHCNLLSILYLTHHCGFVVSIDSGKMNFFQNDRSKFVAPLTQNNSAVLHGIMVPTAELANIVSTLPLDYSLCHHHFAHRNLADVKRMIGETMVTGVQLKSNSDPDPICEPCLAGKMHANPFPSSTHRESVPLALVHTDVHGPLHVCTHSGYCYWATFIDDAGSFWVVSLMHHKSELFKVFQQFQAYAERYLGVQLKMVHSDQGGKYTPGEFLEYCRDLGIQQQFAVCAHPQQNGIAERANRDIHEGITMLLQEFGLPLTFWGEALSIYVHVHNHCVLKRLTDSTR
jgi:hypothetical protein